MDVGVERCIHALVNLSSRIGHASGDLGEGFVIKRNTDGLL